MTAAKSAAWRLVQAETKYDQRIIGALILAVGWWAFWTVADQKASFVPQIAPAVIDLPDVLPDTAGRTLSYQFEFKPRSQQ